MTGRGCETSPVTASLGIPGMWLLPGVHLELELEQGQVGVGVGMGALCPPPCTHTATSLPVQRVP